MKDTDRNDREFWLREKKSGFIIDADEGIVNPDEPEWYTSKQEEPERFDYAEVEKAIKKADPIEEARKKGYTQTDGIAHSYDFSMIWNASGVKKKIDFYQKNSFGILCGVGGVTLNPGKHFCLDGIEIHDMKVWSFDEDKSLDDLAIEARIAQKDDEEKARVEEMRSRIGFFFVGRPMLDSKIMPDVLFEMKFVPFRVEMRHEMNKMEYIGTSPFFHIRPLGSRAPEYNISVRQSGGKLKGITVEEKEAF